MIIRSVSLILVWSINESFSSFSVHHFGLIANYLFTTNDVIIIMILQIIQEKLVKRPSIMEFTIWVVLKIQLFAYYTIWYMLQESMIYVFFQVAQPYPLFFCNFLQNGLKTFVLQLICDMLETAGKGIFCQIPTRIADNFKIFKWKVIAGRWKRNVFGLVFKDIRIVTVLLSFRCKSLILKGRIQKEYWLLGLLDFDDIIQD